MLQTIPVQTHIAPAEAGGGAHPSYEYMGLSQAPSRHHRDIHNRNGPTRTVSKSGQLRYADPRSLPSFPSYGLVPGGAAASAAATFGWSNRNPVEPGSVDKTTTASASAAALLARRSSRMSPSRESVADDAGARAAVLAAGNAEAALKTTASTDMPHDDALGSSAANAAFHANRATAAETGSLSRSGTGATQASYSYTDRIRSQNVEPPPNAQDDGSLAAAKGAMSVPKQPAADAPRASDNALNGATIAHRDSVKHVSIQEAGAIPVTTMTRDMYTSHPPVKLEVDEMNDNERLHQSAVEMAQRMFSRRQHQRTMSTPASTTRSSGAASAFPYPNLQDAAYRQAQERLARLDEEHEKSQLQKSKGFFPKEEQQAPRRRLSLIAKLRRRSLSTSSSSYMERREQSDRTGQPTSMFPIPPPRVDQERRERDRQAILETAQRNVKARLQDMDDKALEDTGSTNANISPEVETAAQNRAQAILYPADDKQGKVDIGGGRFMDAKDIDAIAARKVRPVLDDIDGSVEAERQRLAALKAELEAKRSETKRHKERERERREMDKRCREEEKQDEKARKLREKQEAKARRDESKAAKLEQKRQLKEDKRRLRINTAGTIPGGHPHQLAGADENRNDENEPGAHGATTENESNARQRADDSAADRMENETAAEQGRSHQAPSSPIMKMTGWIKSRFSRGKHAGNESERQKGFVGGAALQRSGDGPNANANAINDNPHNVQSASSTHMRGGTSPRPATSGVDTADERGHSLEAPRQLTDTPSQHTSGSPARDSRFREEMDQ